MMTAELGSGTEPTGSSRTSEIEIAFGPRDVLDWFTYSLTPSQSPEKSTSEIPTVIWMGVS